MEDKPLIFLLHRLLFIEGTPKIFEEIKEDFKTEQSLERVYYHGKSSSVRD